MFTPAADPPAAAADALFTRPGDVWILFDEQGRAIGFELVGQEDDKREDYYRRTRYVPDLPDLSLEGRGATRELPIGFVSPEAVAPGDTVAIVVSPQVLFRGETLRVSDGAAWNIVDLALEYEAPPGESPRESTPEEDARMRFYWDQQIATAQRFRDELGKPFAERDHGVAKPFKQDSQLGADGELPADLVQRFQCDTCEPGQRIILTLKNVSSPPRSLKARAALEGTVIE